MVNQTRLIAAVDSLIDVHQRTGIDLGEWPPVLALVQEVYPDFEPIPESERVYSLEAEVGLYGKVEPSAYATPVGRATFRGAANFPMDPTHRAYYDRLLPHD